MHYDKVSTHYIDAQGNHWLDIDGTRPAGIDQKAQPASDDPPKPPAAPRVAGKFQYDKETGTSVWVPNNGVLRVIGGNLKLIDLSSGEVITDYGPDSSAGSGDGSGSAIYNANLDSQSAANTLKEQQRQFNERLGYDKAVNDQSQNLAARKQTFDEQAANNAIASNPRNFMENFFKHRGYTPPANSAQYGTTPGGYAQPSLGGGMATGQPYFGPDMPQDQGHPMPAPALGGTPNLNPQSYQVGNQQAQMGAVTRSAPPTPVGGTQGADAIGNTIAFNPNTQQINPTANTATNTLGGKTYNTTSYGDLAPQLVATPGVNVNNGTNLGYTLSALQQQNAQQAFEDQNSDLSKNMKYQTGGMVGYADGGVMGKAPLPQMPPGLDSSMGAPQGGVTPEPIIGIGMRSNPELFQMLQGAGGHKYMIGEPTPEYPQGQPEGVVPAEYMPEFLKSRKGKTVMGGDLAGGGPGEQPVGYHDGGIMAAPPQGASGGDAMSMWANGGMLGVPEYPRPTFAMQRQMRSPQPVPMLGTANVGNVQGYATGGTLGMPSESNPYDVNTGGYSPYDSLNQAGAIPPFLDRAVQQGRGNQAYGTNTPQKAYLPSQVPLTSQLGYNQMSPSEQQALQSYVSSYGISPEDYLAQVGDQTSQGRARQNFAFTEQ